MCEEYRIVGFAASGHLPVMAMIKFDSRSTLKPVVNRSFRLVDLEHLGRIIDNIMLDHDGPQDAQTSNWEAGTHRSCHFLMKWPLEAILLAS